MGLMGRRVGCLQATSLMGNMRDQEVSMGVLRGLLYRPVFVAGASDPAIGRFLALGGRRPDGVAATATPSLFDAHTVTTVEFGPFESAQAIDDALRQMLDDTIGTVMRAKGIVATHDEQLHLVQVVGRRREVTALPMSEFAAPTPLTVIALN